MKLRTWVPKNRRAWLWAVLMTLIALTLISLVWLVGRYEQSKFENQLDQSAIQLAADLRSKLIRNAQRLQALNEREITNWEAAAKQLLEQQPEMLRIERRYVSLQIESAANTSYLSRLSPHGIFQHFGRNNYISDVVHACALAAKTQEPAYSMSNFVPQGDGTGYAITDVCLPRIENNKVTGYVVATYSLGRILKEWAHGSLQHQQEISLREADGSMLAQIGRASKEGNHFAVQSVLNLSGITLILHIESWHRTPYWLTNTPTALALLLVLALMVVLWLLYRDMKKRINTEAQLAREMIQQRKAEEVSRQSLERLQKSARLATLGEMASMLSHELNQPLAAIASYASGSLNLLAQHSDEDTNPSAVWDELKIALERIATQSARAGQVIKSVHGFVRRRETDWEFIAAQSLFDAVLPLLHLQAKQLHVQLHVHVEPQLPQVWCDKTLIEQVIINLARNSMQAMDLPSIPNEQRHLTLSAKPSRHERAGEPPLVQFEVTDQGPGLMPSAQLKLFTPFFTTKEEGMGLGLSLCRTVIEQHGATLTYTTRTEPPGTGTTFWFKLMTHHDNNALQVPVVT